jgi:hypothetical protein
MCSEYEPGVAIAVVESGFGEPASNRLEGVRSFRRIRPPHRVMARGKSTTRDEARGTVLERGGGRSTNIAGVGACSSPSAFRCSALQSARDD